MFFQGWAGLGLHLLEIQKNKDPFSQGWREGFAQGCIQCSCRNHLQDLNDASGEVWWGDQLLADREATCPRPPMGLGSARECLLITDLHPRVASSCSQLDHSYLQGWSKCPRGAGMVGGGAAWLCRRPWEEGGAEGRGAP